MTWGKDNEERAAVAKKAQDAYALARALDGRLAAVEASIKELNAKRTEGKSDGKD